MREHDEFQEERCALLSRLMFGWILDAEHGNAEPRFALTSEEYRVRMEDVARREEQT